MMNRSLAIVAMCMTPRQETDARGRGKAAKISCKRPKGRGTPIAELEGMIPFANIEVWTDQAAARRCQVAVYRDGCDLQIVAGDQIVLTQICESAAEALERAERWRPSSKADSKAA